MFRCELHRLDGNEQLWSDWRDLLQRVKPELRLLTPEWFSVWGHTIGSEAPWTTGIEVVAVYDDADGKLFGLLPVGHPKVGLLRVNAMAGYYQPSRVILADESCEYAVGRSVAWFLVELGWNLIQLGPWPMSHKAHLGALSALNELEMPIQKQSSCGVAIAELPATWSQYRDEVIDRKLLRRLNNAEKQLCRAHQIDVQHHRQPSEAETRELIATLGQIEQRSWLPNDPRGRPRFMGATAQQFWLELIQQTLIPHDQLDCWTMSADGQPISFVLAMTSGSTRYVIANNYDESFATNRPGSLLYRRMFEEGFSRGVTRYDFGTNELHYKKQWGAQYLDRMDTFTVAANRIVSGFWNAGIKLKGLFDGTLLSRAAQPAQHTSGEPLPSPAFSDVMPLDSVLAEADELLSEQEAQERKKRETVAVS